VSDGGRDDDGGFSDDVWHEIVDVDGEPARATWVGERDEEDVEAFREIVRAVRRRVAHG
jgi:hypothetical protein